MQYGGCRECRLVVVQGASADAVRWAADNAGWIDVQSNSWGPIYPVWGPVPAGPNTSDPEFVRTVEDAARRQLLFWASGNGALTRNGAVGHPTVVDPRLTPSSIVVGGHDSGYATTWPGFPPHVVSDVCMSLAAHPGDSRTSSAHGGGTSSATPYAAGGAARVLLEARKLLGDTRTGARGDVMASGPAGRVPSGPLADGRLTRAEWRDVVLKTATARPVGQYEDGPACLLNNPLYGATPVRWADVPAGHPEYLQIGYGAVDTPAFVLAARVLRGAAPLPDRTAADRYFAADATARDALHGVFRGD